jgi:CheY-like chemotaxis protein
MENINKLILKTQNLKLLYVEDDEILRISTVGILEDYFDDIFICVDGQDGLDTFNSNEIDVIITDLNMPIMGGIEMIKNIRKKNNTIPILVFSAFNEKNIVDDTEAYNIQGYLYKPMEFQQFIDKLSKAL